MAFTSSPLFQAASRSIQDAARRQFRQSDLGKLLDEVQRASTKTQPTNILKSAMSKYRSATNPNTVLRQLMGAEFGGLCREIQRYSKRGHASERLVNEFLTSLGPAGTLIRSLIDPAKTSGLAGELKLAMGLIRAFGGEVLPGNGKRWSDVDDVQRGMQAMLRRLQEYGFSVVGSEGPPRRAPQPEEGRSTIDVELNPRRQTQRVSADHPMLTGEMVQCPGSTNVYEFGYDIESLYLYVRFQTPHDKQARGSAGALYRYSGVTPEEFLSLYRVRNQGGGTGPGAWVWDVLRVRGTHSQHHKDYELVGIMGGYVPRKAVERPVYQTVGKRGQPLKRPRKVGQEAWYEQRTVRTHEGRMVRSVLPTTRVASTRGTR